MKVSQHISENILITQRIFVLKTIKNKSLKLTAFLTRLTPDFLFGQVGVSFSYDFEWLFLREQELISNLL